MNLLPAVVTGLFAIAASVTGAVLTHRLDRRK